MSIDRYERLNQLRKAISDKVRVAAYCRVSTEREDQANSFENQREYFKKYICGYEGWELFRIFADEGISGTSTRKRKAFNEMIESARAGLFDLIITKEISRFARNTLDSIYYTRVLKQYGVGVIFLGDGINTLDGDAELRLSIMASIAQEESRKTSERVKWGQKRQMEKGVVFGRSLLGYDVKNGKMYINEGGAEIVRMIYNKFVREGKGAHIICRELEQDGIKAPHGGRWQSSVILRIIRNEKYCGDLVQKKTYTPDYLTHDKKYNRGQEEFVIIRDHHEPIVSRELFERANMILSEKSEKKNQKSKYSGRYPFSSKIKCGFCGAGYVSRYKHRRDGSVYKAWRCYEGVKNGKKHLNAMGENVGCCSPSIQNEEIVEAVRSAYLELDFERAKAAAALSEIVIKALMDCSCNCNETDGESERKRQRLIELYLNGIIEREEFEKLRKIYDSRSVNDTYISAEMQNADEIKQQVFSLICGETYDEGFYASIVESLVVYGKGSIGVRFKGIGEEIKYKKGN